VHHADAQVAAVRVRVGAVPAGGSAASATRPDHAALLDAGARTQAVDLDTVRRAELESEVLEAARGWVEETPGADRPGGTILGCPLDDEGLGLGLEGRYRVRARFATTLADRIDLVDRANDARPWTRV